MDDDCVNGYLHPCRYSFPDGKALGKYTLISTQHSLHLYDPVVLPRDYLTGEVVELQDAPIDKNWKENLRLMPTTSLLGYVTKSHKSTAIAAKHRKSHMRRTLCPSALDSRPLSGLLSQASTKGYSIGMSEGESEGERNSAELSKRAVPLSGARRESLAQIPSRKPHDMLSPPLPHHHHQQQQQPLLSFSSFPLNHSHNVATTEQVTSPSVYSTSTREKREWIDVQEGSNHSSLDGMPLDISVDLTGLSEILSPDQSMATSKLSPHSVRSEMPAHSFYLLTSGTSFQRPASRRYHVDLVHDLYQPSPNSSIRSSLYATSWKKESSFELIEESTRSPRNRVIHTSSYPHLNQLFAESSAYPSQEDMEIPSLRRLNEVLGKNREEITEEVILEIVSAYYDFHEDYAGG